MITRLTRGARLAAWVASAMLFGLTTSFAVFLLCFRLFGRWENPSARLDAVLSIVVPCTILIAAWAAIREWRTTDGHVPSRLWWLVIGLGPGAIAAALAVAVCMDH